MGGLHEGRQQGHRREQKDADDKEKRQADREIAILEHGRFDIRVLVGKDVRDDEIKRDAASAPSMTTSGLANQSSDSPRSSIICRAPMPMLSRAEAEQIKPSFVVKSVFHVQKWLGRTMRAGRMAG